MDLFQLGHPRGGVGHGMDLVVVIQIFEAETDRWMGFDAERTAAGSPVAWISRLSRWMTLRWCMLYFHKWKRCQRTWLAWLAWLA